MRAFSSVVVVLSSSYLCQIQNWSLTQPSIRGWVNAHVNCGLSKGLNKGWGGMWQAVPRPLWPRTIPSNMLPPEWTFNFSNYQSNAFCHSQPICFNFCRINLPHNSEAVSDKGRGEVASPGREVADLEKVLETQTKCWQENQFQKWHHPAGRPGKTIFSEQTCKSIQTG